MAKDKTRLTRRGGFKPLFVLTIRSFVESAVFFGLFFSLKFLASGYGVRLLFFAVPAAVLLLSAVVIPLRFGSVLFFLNREKNAESSVGNLFAFFSPALFFSAMRNGCVFLLFFFLCFLTFFLPCISMLILMCYNIFNAAPLYLSALCFAAFAALLWIGAAAFFKMKRLTFLSRYICVLTPGKRGIDSLFESADILNGRTTLVTAVKTKNFFSRLFCVFVFPVGFIVRRCTERNSHLAYELLKERK
ncbi:MAG: hypothetical protein ACI4XE_11880 [Acutalibacteraceae bacterium]